MTLYIDNSIDPKAVLKHGRELDVCPRHFIKVSSDGSLISNQRVVRKWIWQNLTGRFSIQMSFVGFEDPTEATMFGLIQDQFTDDAVF